MDRKPSSSSHRPPLHTGFAHMAIAEDNDPTEAIVPSYKKQAGLGQWKTPPHTLYPITKSVSTPELNLASIYGLDGESRNPSISHSRSCAFIKDEAPTAIPSKVLNHGIPSSSSIYSTYSQGHNDDGDDDSDSYESTTGKRSIKGFASCPDFAKVSASGKLFEDEEETKKRKLARNRASARLRRLKKKTLIETLEQDMAKIELDMKTINSSLQSSSSSISKTTSLAKLILDSSKPYHSSCISKERRLVGLKSIVDRQHRSVQHLWNDYLENAAIAWFAGNGLDPSIEGPPALVAELRNSLEEVLRLTSSQKVDLELYAILLEAERKKMVIVEKYVNTLKMHEEWTKFSCIDNINEFFRSIVDAEQNDKFCEFLDRNVALLEPLTISTEDINP